MPIHRRSDVSTCVRHLSQQPLPSFSFPANCQRQPKSAHNENMQTWQNSITLNVQLSFQIKQIHISTYIRKKSIMLSLLCQFKRNIKSGKILLSIRRTTSVDKAKRLKVKRLNGSKSKIAKLHHGYPTSVSTNLVVSHTQV